jgi:hypothetical protein
MSERQADAEIEITPQMAAAGARVIVNRCDGVGDALDEDIATEVFVAMMREASSEASPRTKR